MKEINEKDVFERINERGFKVYLGKSNLDTVIFSPEGEEIGCILEIEITQSANDKKDMLRKIKLTGLVNIITEQEKNELIELNKINKKEMNG
jgi:hypothetical protein